MLLDITNRFFPRVPFRFHCGRDVNCFIENRFNIFIARISAYNYWDLPITLLIFHVNVLYAMQDYL